MLFAHNTGKPAQTQWLNVSTCYTAILHCDTAYNWSVEGVDTPCLSGVIYPHSVITLQGSVTL